MSKLTTFSFVEIFNERRVAGRVLRAAPDGQLPIPDPILLSSVVTGIFCAERNMLIVQYQCYDSAIDLPIEINPLPPADEEIVTGLSVTDAVRHLPNRATEWHDQIAAAVAEEFPALNPPKDGERKRGKAK
jgi:hypothetical protein